MPLTCPNCGNDRNFLVKTLQMHVVRLDDARVEVNEEGRPAVIEVLCDFLSVLVCIGKKVLLRREGGSSIIASRVCRARRRVGAPPIRSRRARTATGARVSPHLARLGASDPDAE